MARKGKRGSGTQCRAPVPMAGLGHGLDATVTTGLLQGDGCRTSVTWQPLGTARWLASAASPCPEPGHRARPEPVRSWRLVAQQHHGRPGLSLAPAAYAAGDLGRPLDTSSRPTGDAGISAVLAEVPEQWDVGPGTTPLGHVALLSWSCAALDVLLAGWCNCAKGSGDAGERTPQNPKAPRAREADAPPEAAEALPGRIGPHGCARPAGEAGGATGPGNRKRKKKSKCNPALKTLQFPPKTRPARRWDVTLPAAQCDVSLGRR
ncbi:unnamed protein product [Coccothraustes coccothraustes]